MTPIQPIPFSASAGFPVPGDNGGLCVQALMVGSGFTKAIHPGALSWGQLIGELARTLGSPAPATDHWFVEGLRLSRAHSPRKRDAVPTPFQQTVKSLIDKSCSRPTGGSDWAALATALAEFLDATKCTVILDTNYDSNMEWLLQAAGIQYTRLIGSEATSVAPLPRDAVVLWKIHGSVEAPSTIVLSPTEYQRIYESNALGDVMQALGQTIDCLWVLGCGLNDDETWTYLCTDVGPKQVACLWQTTDQAVPPSAPPDWVGQVAANHRQVRVYWAQVENTPQFRADGRRRTAGQLTGIANTVKRSIPHGSKGSQQQWWQGRIDSFDRDYKDVLARKNIPAALAIVAGARADFERLRNYLLSQQRRRAMGETWCAGVPADLGLDDNRRRDLASDFERVVRLAIELRTDWGDSILVAAAAQAAVGYVVELAEILGIHVTVELEDVNELTLAKDQRVLVGANPFFVRADQAHRANLMHFHTTHEYRKIEFPLAGRAATDSRGKELMEENDWEARIIHTYGMRNPCLVLNGEIRIEVGALPPLYPWGFRLGDIKGFRERSDTGTISKCWHLVSNIEGGRQFCKGGGLRDRGRIAFRIGNRGQVRLGEFDAFVQPAYT